MNLIPKIAEVLGVEVGEEFRIKWPTCKKPNEEFYKFTKDGFIYYDQAMCEWEDSIAYVDLISGKAEVVKKPFEPKTGEKFFYVSLIPPMCINSSTWGDIGDCGYTINLAFKYCGNCFRTQAEAEAHKYEIYEKLTGKKWIEVAE